MPDQGRSDTTGDGPEQGGKFGFNLQAICDHNCKFLKMENKPIFRIRAKDTKANNYRAKSFYGLEKDLYLCEGCQVMVNCNLFTNLHVINGVTGHVVSIIYNDDDLEFPKAIVVQLDKCKIPEQFCFQQKAG